MASITDVASRCSIMLLCGPVAAQALAAVNSRQTAAAMPIFQNKLGDCAAAGDRAPSDASVFSRADVPASAALQTDSADGRCR